MSTSSASRVKHRWWLPLTPLVVGFGLLGFAQFLELPAEASMPLFGMSAMIIVAGLVFVLPVWWCFASGFSRRTRIVGIVMVLVVLAALFAVIRKIELLPFRRIGLYPRITFIWDPNPEEILADHLGKQQQLNDALPPIDLRLADDDYPRYRGRNGDGIIADLNLYPSWDARQPRIVWKHPCGGGYGGFAVVGNVIITLEQRKGGKEAVTCYDRATGRQRWAYEYPAFHKDAMGIGDGPRSTPLVDHGDVFTLGATGELLCVEGKTGAKKWGVNILEDNKASKIKWGMTGSPLLVGNLIVVNPGIDPDNPAPHSLAAYDRSTGNKVWSANQRKAAYSSPQLVTLKGTRQILLFDGEGVAGFDPKDGRELWSHPWLTEYDMNSVQPVVLGDDRVFISSEATNGGVLLRVNREGDAWTVEVVWKNKNLGARYANPVSDGQHIFGLHGQRGTLVCVDVASGARLWSSGDIDFGPGQLLLCGKSLIVQDGGTGDLCLVDADPKAYREQGRFQVFNDKTWNTSALAGRFLFMRNEKNMACVELPVK